MSLQTQLLRGLMALPMLMLLALAGMAAPGEEVAAAARASHAAKSSMVVVAADGSVLVVDRALAAR